MEHEHIKSLNTDSRSKNRIRYASTRDRAKRASADVYRSYKRRIGVTSAASREERVHHPDNYHSPQSPRKKQRRASSGGGGGTTTSRVVSGGRDGKTALIRHDGGGGVGGGGPETEFIHADSEDAEEGGIDTASAASIFASELDLAHDRNASEIFKHFYRRVYPLVRSLPEVLHHADDVVDSMLRYMLSPESAPNTPTPPKEGEQEEEDRQGGSSVGGVVPPVEATKAYVVNHATTDILHLLSVLARDLRHELHRHVHRTIVPRIVYDLLNPPAPPPTSERQQRPLDVKVVEAAFRTLGYVFRYDVELIRRSTPGGDDDDDRDDVDDDAAAGEDGNKKDGKKKKKKEKKKNIGRGGKGRGKGGGCPLESMRQYYGATLAHKRDYIRRLSAETFAPLIRRLPTDADRARHVRRVLRALAASASSSAGGAAAAAGVAAVAEEPSPPASASAVVRSVQRARSDAVDGVSLLLFQTACGVPGRLHSKARIVLGSILGCMAPGAEGERRGGKKKKKKTTKTKKNGKTRGQDKLDAEEEEEEERKREVTYLVVSKFVSMLCHHVQTSGNFGVVWEELRTYLGSSIEALLLDAQATSTDMTSRHGIMGGLDCLLKVTEQCVSYRSGTLLGGVGKDFEEEEAEELSGILQRLLDENMYPRLDQKVQASVLHLLCSTWRANPDYPLFASRFSQFFPSITKQVNHAESDTHISSVDPALLLAKDLMPYLPWRVAMRSLAPTILAAAAQRSSQSSDSSLLLVHALATAKLTSPPTDEDDANDDERLAGDLGDEEDDDDSVFWSEHARDCVVSVPEREMLLDVCLVHVDASAKAFTKEGLSRLGFATRCVPFLSNIHCEGSDGKKDDASLVRRVFKWCLATLKALDEGEAHLSAGLNESDKLLSSDVVVAKSLVLESLAIVIAACQKEEVEKSATLKTLAKAQKYASALLKARPHSIWSVKAVAAIVRILETNHMQLNDSPEEVFEVLTPNLRAESHFLRLHSLVILNSYPRRPFITDHDDLDLTDDLDEEPSFRPSAGIGNDEENEGINASGRIESKEVVQKTASISGPCDIIQTLLKIESMPVKFKNERRLTSEISRVEVLGRTGRLPVAYAEAAANHMLGIFNVKFAPLWPAAVQALAAIASAQESCAWPCLQIKLKQVMAPSVKSGRASKDTDGRNTSEEQSVDIVASSKSEFLRHQELCVAWDKSNGRDIGMFGSRPYASEGGGKVSRHKTTDEATIFELTWRVMESVPQLTARKSKVVVPIFLDFLYFQYYLFHNDDPDAREMALQNHVGDVSILGRSLTREDLSKKSLQKRLTSFLKMFAAINGPQQLFKHKLLLTFFSVTLSNPDTSITHLALTCLMKYKLSHLMPYSEQLRSLLVKGQLRETLTKFDLSNEGGVVDSHHRKGLIPVVVRILFGRFSARGSGAKSSKDSPAARRAAILSFLTGLGRNEGELDYFVYMMVRVFIPKTVDMTMDSTADACRINQLIQGAQSVDADEVGNIHSQRIEGFLNLFSDVITQIGFGVEKDVPVFVSLLLTICECAESMRKSSSEDTKDSAENDEGDTTSTMQDQSSWSMRVGNIRSLCFHRLTDLFVKFASACDFNTYGERLWTAVTSAVQKLPSSVINAEKPPGLLLLLECLSSHPDLIPLLQQHEESVEAVFRCIAVTSRHQVVGVALAFVDNLLTEGGTMEERDQFLSGMNKSLGAQLIQRHIHLLVRQFTERLESGSPEVSSRKAEKKESQIAQRELSILCRVSELLVSEDSRTSAGTDIGVMENLCSLLVPFLLFERRADESNQRDVLSILERIIPKIGGQAALSHLQALSKILGPNKGDIGIASLEIRQMIVSVIAAIANHDQVGGSLKDVAESLTRLCAIHPQHIDECNFDEVLPVLNKLGSPTSEDGSWLSLAIDTDESSGDDELQCNLGVKAITPLVYCCFHMLYDTDGVLSRGALKALKTLVSISASHAASASGESDGNQEGTKTNVFVKMIETSFVSSVRVGLSTKQINVRRSFVLLLSEVARAFASFENENLYGDLSILIRDDNQDLDFFLNVTHVQVHRRGRAFDRLRKILFFGEASSGDNKEANKCPFSAHSLSNVLLPLAVHPIYECNSKTEEIYALEAVATVGAIAKHLPWGKYQSTLWTALTQLSRNPEQERYLVAMICAIIDAFHFEVVVDSNSEPKASSFKEKNSHKTDSVGDASEARQEQEEGNAVWRSLKKRLIPKIEGYLVKEKVERGGSVVKTLRSPVALALVKLFQKLPQHVFDAKLPRILTVICGGLKSRDSQARTVARETLARIAASIDVRYLSEIIRELAITLSEGYQLHVRSAALHSIILAVSKVYKRPKSLSAHEARHLPFDQCVPAVMDLIQQDIFGSASEIKEVKYVQKRLVKEAVGVKSYETLEIVSQCLLFKPSLAAVVPSESDADDDLPASAVHAVVVPLLERLRDPEVSTSTIGKAKECLSRVTIGLSHNDSLTAEEVMSFVYASVSPFVGGDALRSKGYDGLDSGNSSDEDQAEPIQITRTKIKTKAGLKHNSRTTEVVKREVFEWRPSSLKAPKDAKKALEEKRLVKADFRKVRDGASAPKLTGTSRYDAIASSHSHGMNDPAGASAVVFGLSLFYSCMKKSKLNVRDEKTLMMADPYVLMLTKCVRDCNDNKVILLSLRCLGFLLKMNLPSVPRCSTQLSGYTLRLLTMSGSAADTKNEITQGCFKTLTLLISMANVESTGQSDLKPGSGIPLDERQMQALVSLLLSAVTESEQNTATSNLIKAILSKRFISPEFYDLMETILKLSVQSQNASVRQQCCQIFMQFLIDYPMGKQRIEDHLKQIVLNIKYEYEEGRISATGLLRSVIQKLPTLMIEEHAQLFFLPLVLQLVNDDSKQCREAVADCISSLLQRLSFDSMQTIYDYVARWSSQNGPEALPLQRTSAQVYGIFVESRQDFIKRGDMAVDLIKNLHESLRQELGHTDGDRIQMATEWELPYFSLVCLEKMYKQFPSVVDQNHELWVTIVKCLVHPHPWVKQTSSRILNAYASNLDPRALVSKAKSPECFLVATPGSLYEIARNLCHQLNAEEREQVDAISVLATKTLTWVVQTMSHYPELCFKDGDKGLDVGDDAAEDETGQANHKDPVLWLMMRLSNIAKARGIRRREAVFKCFAAFASSCDESIIAPHLELMIEPLNRTIIEVASRAESSSRRRPEPESDDAELPKEVLQLLEDKCGTEKFLNALAFVKSKAREKREKRKQEAAAEAVHDPRTAAKRRIQKQEREKKRRKRRVEEKKASRGVHGKRYRPLQS